MSPIVFALDFILTDGDNGFMVTIRVLDPFVAVDTDKGVEREVTDHQCLPALRCEGVLP